jgi:hypothetical protein
VVFAENVYAGRTRDYSISLYENDGTTVLQLAAGDVVRVKIGRGNDVPDLDLDSAAASPNGSSVTVDNLTTVPQVTLRLAQGDTDDLLGTYDVDVSVVDDSETTPADAIKHAEQGCLYVLPTQAGDVGKT